MQYHHVEDIRYIGHRKMNELIIHCTLYWLTKGEHEIKPWVISDLIWSEMLSLIHKASADHVEVREIVLRTDDVTKKNCEPYQASDKHGGWPAPF